MSSWNAGVGSAKTLQEEPDERLLGLVSPGISSVTQDVPRGAKKRTRQCVPKDDPDDDDLSDEPLNPTEKKRRLTVEQVNFLEQSFTADLKLEPERKALIAKQLGIRPRQVAIWFQNRRARWKNKQLEQDYEALKAKYDAEVKEKESLMKDHGLAMENNKKLHAEVARLKSLLEGVESSGGVNTIPTVAELDEGLVKEEEVSGKSEVASPTKSVEDQSETQDSGQSYPTPTEAVVDVAADDPSVEEFNSAVAADAKLDPDYFLSFFPPDDYYGITGPSFLAHQLGLCLEEAYNLFGSNEDQFGALPWAT